MDIQQSFNKEKRCIFPFEIKLFNIIVEVTYVYYLLFLFMFLFNILCLIRDDDFLLIIFLFQYNKLFSGINLFIRIDI